MHGGESERTSRGRVKGAMSCSQLFLSCHSLGYILNDFTYRKHVNSHFFSITFLEGCKVNETFSAGMSRKVYI